MPPATTTRSVPSVVDLGCGNNPRQGAFGVDVRDYPAVDLQADVRDLPEAWTNQVSRAYASQLFEHLTANEIAEALAEVSRILEPGGILEFDVPYARTHENTDPTHETKWCFQKIAYYLPRREVDRLGWSTETFPDYYRDHDIDLEFVDRDCIAWLHTTHLPGRAVSWLLRETSLRVSRDDWDAFPVIGGWVGGNLVFRLRKPGENA